MTKKILFLFFILGKDLVVLALLIYGVYKLCTSNNKSELELILDTYKVNNDYKDKIIANKPLTLEEKLKILPNKNGEIQLKKIKAMTQSFEEIITLHIDEDKETIIKYKNSVNQIYQAIQDNLHHYCLVIKSIEPINSKIMYEASIYSEEEKNDLAQEWSTLFSKQKKRAKDILVQNEQAITQVYIFITDIINNNFNKKPVNNMEKALEKLTQLTIATKQYSDESLISPYQ